MDDRTKAPPLDIRRRNLSFTRLRQAVLKKKDEPDAGLPECEDRPKEPDHSRDIEEFRKRQKE
jgi:hypothetical protein